MIASKAQTPPLQYGGRQYKEKGTNEKIILMIWKETSSVENANQIEYKQKHNRTH